MAGINLGKVLASTGTEFLQDGAKGIMSAAVGSLLSAFPGHTVLGSLGRSMTGSGLTGAQLQANQFTHDESQLAYERELAADSTAVQRRTADMRAAGINPILAVGSAGGSVNGAPGSSVSPAASNLFALAQMAMQERQLKIQEKLANANVDKIGAEIRNIDARTEETGLNVGFFRDTQELRKVLLGDEHERNEWEKEIGLRGVQVKEDNQRMLEENSRVYNAHLEQMDELIAEQVKSEPLKRALYSANAAEARQNAAYKAAMAEVDKQYTEARTESERAEKALLIIEARVKNGIYNEQYIRDLCKAMHEEAAGIELTNQLRKGDYSGVSRGLQRLFEGIENAGKHRTIFNETAAGANGEQVPLYRLLPGLSR